MFFDIDNIDMEWIIRGLNLRCPWCKVVLTAVCSGFVAFFRPDELEFGRTRVNGCAKQVELLI